MGCGIPRNAEIVLEKLHLAGIPRDHIRFICATGTHGALNRQDFVRKLGEKIVEEYPVFNHNPFGMCRLIYYTPYPDWSIPFSYDEPEKVTMVKSWDEVLKLLPDEKAQISASVISVGSMSYFAAPSGQKDEKKNG